MCYGAWKKKPLDDKPQAIRLHCLIFHVPRWLPLPCLGIYQSKYSFGPFRSICPHGSLQTESPRELSCIKQGPSTTKNKPKSFLPPEFQAQTEGQLHCKPISTVRAVWFHTSEAIRYIIRRHSPGSGIPGCGIPAGRLLRALIPMARRGRGTPCQLTRYTTKPLGRLLTRLPVPMGNGV